jgi:exosome complex component CSL4
MTMTEEEVRNEEFVTPGDLLGVVEEILPGNGAFEEDGKVYAAITGKISRNQEEGIVEVIPLTHSPRLPQNGDIIIGKVEYVKSQGANVSIAKIDGEVEFSGSMLGSVHISKVREQYVNSIDDEYKEGDMVRAKVINVDTIPIQLATVGPDFGVIRAYCSSCRGELIRDGGRLECADCGKVERRNLSRDYGQGVR